MRNTTAHRLKRGADLRIEKSNTGLGTLHHAFRHLPDEIAVHIREHLTPELGLVDVRVDIDDDLVVIV